MEGECDADAVNDAADDELREEDTLALASVLSDGDTEEPYDCDALTVPAIELEGDAEAEDDATADELSDAETLKLAPVLSDGDTEEP